MRGAGRKSSTDQWGLQANAADLATAGRLKLVRRLVLLRSASTVILATNKVLRLFPDRLEILYVLFCFEANPVGNYFGAVFFLVVLLLKKHMVSTLPFSGPIAGLERAVATKLLKQYDKVALFGLLSFWLSEA